jgi:hypothetical protein
MEQVLCHPLIVLELACGTLPAPCERTLGDLKKLRQSVIATNEDALELIEREQLLRSAPLARCHKKYNTSTSKH